MTADEGMFILRHQFNTLKQDRPKLKTKHLIEGMIAFRAASPNSLKHAGPKTVMLINDLSSLTPTQKLELIKLAMEMI